MARVDGREPGRAEPGSGHAPPAGAQVRHTDQVQRERDLRGFDCAWACCIDEVLLLMRCVTKNGLRGGPDFLMNGKNELELLYCVSVEKDVFTFSFTSAC